MIDLSKEDFSILCHQKGECFKNYRKYESVDKNQKFEIGGCTISLIEGSGKNGKKAKLVHKE